ncbi:hypothetical protein AVEN_192571-1 [Araneus ventricosus]|uniref:Uncharacterized protein n=1 Tax=Araneus ventricosus TaxID=182803 RepID=A0A4Y2HY33_ARAVE|nr:hypothetical protein AVEN_192571-1 [Araneus ventricosus]
MPTGEPCPPPSGATPDVKTSGSGLSETFSHTTSNMGWVNTQRVVENLFSTKKQNSETFFNPYVFLCPPTDSEFAYPQLVPRVPLQSSRTLTGPSRTLWSLTYPNWSLALYPLVLTYPRSPIHWSSSLVTRVPHVSRTPHWSHVSLALNCPLLDIQLVPLVLPNWSFRKQSGPHVPQLVLRVSNWSLACSPTGPCVLPATGPSCLQWSFVCTLGSRTTVGNPALQHRWSIPSRYCTAFQNIEERRWRYRHNILRN